MKPFLLVVLSLIALILTLVFSIMSNKCSGDVSDIKNQLQEWQLEQ